MAIVNSDIVIPDPVMRHQVADYLGVGSTFELMGIGFESLDEKPNAQSSSKTYINQKAESSTITSYKTEFPFAADMIKSEKALMAIYAVGRDHLTGKEAMFEYVRVDLYKTEESPGDSFPARKFIVSAEIADVTGEGGSSMAISGTLKAFGDPVLGSFDVKAKKFTAAGAGAGLPA